MRFSQGHAVEAGVLGVRYGKGGRYRELPLHPQLRTALEEWRAARANWPGAAENPALFLNRRGARLTTRGAYDELKKIAADANLEFGRDGDLTPHALRHTAGTNMIRDGEDIVVVAEILGHSIETARQSCPPSRTSSGRGTPSRPCGAAASDTATAAGPARLPRPHPRAGRHHGRRWSGPAADPTPRPHPHATARPAHIHLAPGDTQLGGGHVRGR